MRTFNNDKVSNFIGLFQNLAVITIYTDKEKDWLAAVVLADSYSQTEIFLLCERSKNLPFCLIEMEDGIETGKSDYQHYSSGVNHLR